MALEELISDDSQREEGGHVLRVFGSIFLSILCPFIGLPLLALEYHNHKREEPVQVKSPEKAKEEKREYSSFNDYFGDVYNWLRTRRENEKVYTGIYNSGNSPMKLSLSIS